MAIKIILEVRLVLWDQTAIKFTRPHLRGGEKHKFCWDLHFVEFTRIIKALKTCQLSVVRKWLIWSERQEGYTYIGGIGKSQRLWAACKALLSHRNTAMRFHYVTPLFSVSLGHSFHWQRSFLLTKPVPARTLVRGLCSFHLLAGSTPFPMKTPKEISWQDWSFPSSWFRPHRPHGCSFMLGFCTSSFYIASPPYNHQPTSAEIRLFWPQCKMTPIVLYFFLYYNSV
jgi:hypothetical protein